MKKETQYDPRLPLPSSAWTPPLSSQEASSLCSSFTTRLQRLVNTHPARHLHPDSQSRQLSSLRQRPDIKLLQTDKNLGLVALDTLKYHSMVLGHLNNTRVYRRVDLTTWDNRLDAIRRQALSLYKRLGSRSPITPQVLKYLAEVESTLPAFHILPKLHKATLSSRPIVGSPAWITTKWSKYLDTHLVTLETPFVLRDSFDLITQTEGLTLPDDAILVTADVESLYTNMSLDRLYSTIGKRTSDPIWTAILRFICSNNFFEYNSEVFRQIDGIAMGTNAAVSCANLYLDEFDRHFAPSCKLYRRYIDDIFFVWTGSAQDLSSLTTAMNTFVPGIRLTFSQHPSTLAFLDININVKNSKICFSTFQKLMNRYLYLPPFTNHPRLTLKGFIKGELIRYLRTNTSPEDFFSMKSLFWKRLVARGYPRRFLKPIFAQVASYDRDKWLSRTPKDEAFRKVIPLVIPFSRHPVTPKLVAEVFKLNDHFATELLNIRLLVAFKKPPSLFNLVCRSKLTSQQQEFIAQDHKVASRSSRNLRETAGSSWISPAPEAHGTTRISAEAPRSPRNPEEPPGKRQKVGELPGRIP